MRLFFKAFSALAVLSACASVPRDSCTADWFEYEAAEIQRDFARRNRTPLRRLRILRTDLDEGPDVFTALALVSARRDLEVLVTDLRGRVVPEARRIAATCEIDEGFDTIMEAFLTEQGIDAELVRLLGLTALLDTPELAVTLEPAS